MQLDRELACPSLSCRNIGLVFGVVLHQSLNLVGER
jgi:hypothetical protein